MFNFAQKEEVMPTQNHETDRPRCDCGHIKEPHITEHDPVSGNVVGWICTNGCGPTTIPEPTPSFDPLANGV